MESLADAGLATMKRFKLLQGVEKSISVDNQSNEWPKNLFLAQFDRFELWAVNLGVFVMGHGSLDYRIRDSESMKEAIFQMMKNLNRSLDEILAYLNGDVEQEDEDSDTDSEIESDMDLLLDSIKDPIDRLYKMAVWIRNPATRLPFSKARNFKQVDEETKVDLFKSFEHFDYDHVSSLFLEYEKNKAVQENPTVQYHDAVGDGGVLDDGDQVWESIRKTLELNKTKISNGTESYLIRRIAQANGRRRQQFAYWRKHKDKLREHTTAVVEAPTHKLSTESHIIEDENERPKGPLTVTTATQLRLSHVAGKEVFEKQDALNFSVSEYAPSAWNPSKDIVSFPLPPKISTTDEFFECPYCYTICPASLLSERAWRAHLIRDLRPYLCTFEHCLNSEQLYDSRDDWIQHETSTHQSIFRCPKHEEESFTTLAAYEEHTQVYHKEDTTSLYFAKSTTNNIHRSCPMCSIVLEGIQKLQSHIALHLERFAMFALPRSTDDVEGEDLESRSTGAFLNSDRSLSENLDTKSNATGEAEEDNIVNKLALNGIRRKRGDLELALSRMRVQTAKGDQYDRKELQQIYDLLSIMAKMIRTSPPSETANMALFEFGETCINAGVIEEAIEALERLQTLQNDQLEHDDPALLQTKVQLTLAYQLNESLQEVDKHSEFGTILHTEPGKSKALDIFARTGAGMKHAETIWGPDIWKTRQDSMDDDGIATHTKRIEEEIAYIPQMGRDLDSGTPSPTDTWYLRSEFPNPALNFLGNHVDVSMAPHLYKGVGWNMAQAQMNGNPVAPGNSSTEEEPGRDSLDEQAQNRAGDQKLLRELLQQQEQLRAQQAPAPDSKAWNLEDNLRLLSARMQGLSWDQIRDQYFPSKTPDACRKHHELRHFWREEGGLTEQEAKDDQHEHIQEDVEMQEQREQEESELQVFRRLFKQLESNVLAEIALEDHWPDHWPQSESKARTLAKRMALFKSEVDKLRDLCAMEAQELEKVKKLHALDNKIRSFEFEEIRETIKEIQHNRTALEMMQEKKRAQLEREYARGEQHGLYSTRDSTKKIPTSGGENQERSSRRYRGRPNFWRCCKCSGGWYSYQVNDSCPMCQSWRCDNCEYSYREETQMTQ